MPTEIRCSSLPRILACPASLVPPAQDIRGDDEAARIGSAVHVVLAAWLTNSNVDMAAVARAYRVDVDDIAPLVGVGRRLWDDYQGALGNPEMIEAMLSMPLGDFVLLTGHVDVSDYTAKGEPYVWDWKTGSQSADYKAQMRGYALLRSKGERDVLTLTAWLREGVVDVDIVTVADMGQLRRDITEAMRHRDTFRTGPHCGFCPRRLECPALAAERRAAIATFLPAVNAAPAPPAERLAELKPKADMLRRALDAYDKALRRALEEAGTLPLPDGRELYLAERRREKVVMNTVTWDILETYLGKDGILDVLDVNKKRALDAVRAKAPEKGQRVKDMLENLRDMDCIAESTYKMLAVRPKFKALEGKTDESEQ